MDSSLEVRRLVQGYGRRTVLAGLDLSLGHGLFGLLGPNGAGKTTLMNTLATATPPRSGLISVCGEIVNSEASARRARRHIGYLPQTFGYFKNFTVQDFISYTAWLRGVPRAFRGKAVDLAIDAVELRPNVKMKALSGGMVRRAGIASAIVGSPEVVLLDEPTVGLDPAQRLDFRNILRSLACNRTIVLCTHLVEDVDAVCDAVLVMAEGSIRFRGSPGQLTDQAERTAPGDSALERGYMSVLQRAAAQ